ncbi:MAG: SusE domain-containing protein, partial [Ginsengibacter sp.]
MKYLSQLFLLAVITVAFSACEKAEKLPFYSNGSPVTLTASTTTISPAPVDSNKVALAFNWTFPNYATDTSNVKYILELDVAGRNFSKAYTREIMGNFKTEFLAKEINAIALSYGFDFGKSYDMEARIISSYANNNERLKSNTLALKVTPYKVPPKVKLPDSGNLFIVGNATNGGWNQNMPIPSQQFSRIDETTFGGVFELQG